MILQTRFGLGEVGIVQQMRTLSEMFPQIHSGSVISAVDLIRGIGYYAGLEIIKVKGATGLANTNYEGKVEAALKQLREKDFVFLHIEASDEAGHDGDLQLKLQTIENLDHRAVEPIYNEVKNGMNLYVLLSSPTTPLLLRFEHTSKNLYHSYLASRNNS